MVEVRKAIANDIKEYRAGRKKNKWA
jgi:hypothetical protein